MINLYLGRDVMWFILSRHSAFFLRTAASWSTNCCFGSFPDTSFSIRIACVDWWSRYVLENQIMFLRF